MKIKSIHSKSILNRFTKYALILTAFLLSYPSAEAKVPPPGSGAHDVPANILLMLDTSGSMNDNVYVGSSNSPYDMAFDSNNNVYIARWSNSVDKFDSAGNFVLNFGRTDAGLHGDGEFNRIYSIAIDSSDNLYVADHNNARVQKFSSDGTFLLRFNLQVSGKIYGIAVDSSNVVYAVNNNQDIEKYTASGSYISTINVNSNTRHLAVASNGDIYITRYDSSRVERYNSAGVLQSTFTFSYKPLGIEISNTGRLFITDFNGHKIREYTSAGVLQNTWGAFGSALGQFNNPRGIAKRADDTMWVADFNNNRIQSPTGSLLFTPPGTQTKLSIMKNVIRSITSNSDLTSGANFGLVTWATSATKRVNISDTGASEIYNMINSLTASGYTNIDSAMNTAWNYLILDPNSPADFDASCQQNIIIVISDGDFTTYVTGDDVAEDFNNDYGVKTFMVGFLIGNNANYQDLSEAGGTYPDSPLYANNQQQLLEVLSNYIRQIISTSLTFSAPVIIPGITNDDHIIQSTFIYKPEHQWKGHFLKFALNSDGTLGSQLWDAGELLNDRAADSRNIWTVADGLTHSINNFTVANAETIRDPMEELAGTAFGEDALEELIEFIRGKDSYNEYPSGVDDDGVTLLPGERWKLADVYNSKAVAVGPPSAYMSDEANVNSEAYYRHANGYAGYRTGNSCGTTPCNERKQMLYVGSNSGMLHAFNSTTGQEEWAFIPPGLLPKLKDVIALTAGTSTSIFGVDASPIVKDIKIDGEWRTILMIGLRQGGNSFSILDITNPDSPNHLFSVSNNTLTEIISYWDASGNRTDTTYDSLPPEYDYRELGESWADPTIINIKIGEERKWVAVMGAGFNNGVNPNYGGGVYIIDLENTGQIIEYVSITDTSPNSIEASVPMRVTAITADSTTLFQHAGALIYFNDLEGKMWKLNLSDQEDTVLFDLTQVFDVEATAENDRYTFFENAATVTPEHDLMQFYGTTDITRIGVTSDDIANRAYGVKDVNFPNFTPVSPQNASNLQDMTSGLGCPAGSQAGWYLNMNDNEKITARLTVKNNIVFIPSYTPDNANICHSGAARLRETEFTCGGTVRTSDLGLGVPTEVVVYKNKVYIGISSDADATGSLPEGFVKDGNLIIGNPANPSNGRVRIESWWEDF